MASTIPLQRTATFASQHVKNTPLSVTPQGDPLLSMADWVRQFILSAPFAWRWNRSQVSGSLVQGQQDFTISCPDFGWLEKGIYVDPTGATFELQAVETLGQESIQNQPQWVATLMDDDETNVTFRVSPPPPNGCTVYVVYQKAAPVFQSAADTWAPIPDWLSFLFQQGLLAKAYEYVDDSRAIAAMQIFIKQVVGANEGLTDAQKAIFIPEIAMLQRTTQSMMQGANLGKLSKGLFQ